MARSGTSPTLVVGVDSPEGLALLEDTTAIKIMVGRGDERVSWVLPKSLLAHHSKFFDAALNGTFAESQSGSITMPDDSPDAFRQFVQWLYVGDIKTDDGNAWLGAWVLGDKIGSIAFRDCAMTKLVHSYDVRSVTVATIYRTSMSGSKLRKWALDEVLFNLNEGGSYHDADWMPIVEREHEFAADVAKATIRRYGPKNPSTLLKTYLGE